MTNLVAHRKALGLTQAEFARLIGVSRSVISMAESGHRPLSTDALIRLGEFQRASEHPLPDPNQEEMDQLAALSEQQRERELKALTKVEQQLEQQRQKLLKMQEQHQSAETSLRIIAEERSVFQDIPSYLLNLERMEKEARSFWMRSHPVNQRKLALHIAELEALVALRRQWIDSHSILPIV